ncbi:MAG: wobble nucleotide-excising tRNase [Flavobacteriales bacterium]|jgi:wobble nucleotide-excising tRNase
MITKLNNFTHKSFVDYTNPNNLLFCTKNILFGYNGKGKSSIAIGIKNEFLKNPIKNQKNFRVFDRDYISTSLLLENTDGKIKGIEASFGKGVVDIENKVKELEKLIISKTEIDKLDLNIVRLKKEIRTDIDTIHNRRKGKSNIQKKSKDETVERVIELYKKDFKEAKKIESDDNKLIEVNGDNSIEKQISQNENLRPLSFSDISTTLKEEVNIIFKEKFGEDISIPEYEIVQWIESGIKIHKDGDNCKFCNNKLDYSNIKSKITHYKENKRHKATIKLKQFREQLQEFLESIYTIQKETKTYSTNIGNEVEQYFTTITEKENDIQSLINSCQSKIDKIEIQENFDLELLTAILQKIEDSIVNINTIKNEQLSELRKKLNNLTTLVKGAIGLEISKSTNIKDKLKDVEIKVREIKDKRENNIKIQKQIQDLKQQKSLTKDFADFVSQILSDINISLKVTLDSDNRNYIIKSTNENATLIIKDISEGEKNLLALLFFYFELFVDNKQQQIKPAIELIIVDDPISSMDDSNKFYILELMKNLLELTNQQIFVMTHSWEDYCNLSYGKDNNQSYATFELRKNNGLSELVKLSSKEKPYNYLFKEIYAFSRKSDEDLKTECQIYHYPNVMRRIFEEWYGFKIGKDMNFTSNLQKRIESHFKITSNNEKTKLGLLIKVCNILSHSINGSMNPQEIHQSSKYLMNLISKNDKLHFDHMKQ